MWNPKGSWLMAFLDMSHAITKTPTRCNSEWILLASLSFGWCLLCLSCPGEIKLQRRALCRAYCTSRRRGMQQNLLFWCSMSLLAWGRTQLTGRQVTEPSLTNVSISTPVLCKPGVQSLSSGFAPSRTGCLLKLNTCLNTLLYQPAWNVWGSQHKEELLSWALY